MKTIFLCALMTLIYLFLFYIWGRAFLSLIHARISLSESVAFGYIVMQVIYQAFYLPALLTRGSFRTLSIIWIVASSSITIICLFLINRRPLKPRQFRYTFYQVFFMLAAISLIAWLCALIELHPRPYGADNNYYIEIMNDMVYHDSIFLRSGAIDLHHGFNSIFSLFATSFWITGVAPYYIALFTMRSLNVCLTSIVAYRTGKALLDRSCEGVSWYALSLSMLVSFALMFWSSMYTGMFFWLRSNEAKSFLQYILLPLSFSVYVEMFLKDADRKLLWIKQLAIALSAMPIAASSMTSYLLLSIVSTAALLVYDHFRNFKATILCALPCLLPNIIYMIAYKAL